jgi:hypothetical protein
MVYQTPKIIINADISQLNFACCNLARMGFSVFDLPEGIRNLKYAANHNISTYKLNSFYILRVKRNLKSGLLPPAEAGGNQAQTSSWAIAQKTERSTVKVKTRQARKLSWFDFSQLFG